MDEETKILAAEYIKKHRDGRICIVVTHEKAIQDYLMVVFIC